MFNQSFVDMAVKQQKCSIWPYRNTFFLPAFALFHKTPKEAHGVRQIRVNTWTSSYTKYPLSGTFSYNLPFRDSLKKILEGTVCYAGLL